MAIRKAHISLTGRNAILLHNGQTADPRNRYAKDMKAISGKRKKTDADLDQLAKVEWFAGLYLGKYQRDGQTFATTTIPAHVLEAAIIGGAKKSKRGPIVKSGVYCDKQAILSFTGKPQGDLTEEQLKTSLDGLYESGDHHLTVGVKVGQSKVMRTRPMFENWTAEFDLEFDDEVVTASDVKEVINDAGRLVGLGDWRPKYGRFDAVVEIED